MDPEYQNEADENGNILPKPGTVLLPRETSDVTLTPQLSEPYRPIPKSVSHENPISITSTNAQLLHTESATTSNSDEDLSKKNKSNNKTSRNLYILGLVLCVLLLIALGAKVINR